MRNMIQSELIRLPFAIPATITGIFVLLFGAFPEERIAALVILMSCDYFFGVLAAADNGEINSSKGLRGIVKKMGLLFLLVAANSLDVALCLHTAIRVIDVVFTGIVANECFSIAENIGRYRGLKPKVRKLLSRYFTRIVDVLEKEKDDDPA